MRQFRFVTRFNLFLTLAGDELNSNPVELWFQTLSSLYESVQYLLAGIHFSTEWLRTDVLLDRPLHRGHGHVADATVV